MLDAAFQDSTACVMPTRRESVYAKSPQRFRRIQDDIAILVLDGATVAREDIAHGHVRVDVLGQATLIGICICGATFLISGLP